MIMKTAIAILLAATACFPLRSISEAQTVEFEFTPGANTFAAGGTDFSTPSYITFAPATGGSFSLDGNPTAGSGADYFVSYDFNTPFSAPYGELDTGNTGFGKYTGPATQSAMWSSTAISGLNLTVNMTSSGLVEITDEDDT